MQVKDAAIMTNHEYYMQLALQNAVGYEGESAAGMRRRLSQEPVLRK